MLNRWDAFTVSVIDVDVVVGVGVGIDQDKDDEEEEEEENIGWELGETIRTIYSKDRGRDKIFDVWLVRKSSIWSIVRERNGWTMTLNCGIYQFGGQNVFFSFFFFIFRIKTYFLFYFIYLL